MKYYAANWKMNKGPKATRDFFSEFKLKYKPNDQKSLIFFPSAFSLEAAANALDGSQIQFGAQNCYSEVKGAFTGENSSDVVRELGGQWVLVGHSERRSLFSESDKMISKKIAHIQGLDLVPLLCIGETLEERQGMETSLILEMQMRRDLSQADKNKKIAIAYEPVWAIGTGKVATTTQVVEAHEHIRTVLGLLGFSKTTPILYGGSVKPENASELISLPHVDGFLIGGASLEVKSFLDIVNAD